MLGKFGEILFPDRYFAIWIENVGENPTVIARKKLFPTDSTTSYNDKSHVVDMSKPTYRIKNKFFYFIDFQHGQRRIGKPMPKMDNDLLDDIISRNLGRQLMLSMSPGLNKDDWMMYLVFAGLGAFASATVLMLYMGGM